MKTTALSAIMLILCIATSFAQTTEPVELHTDTGLLHGVLELPELTNTQVPLVFIIPGSGPTDRDGNNPMARNDAYKLLAQGLQKDGIASLRIDKRGVRESAGALLDESELVFTDYVDDVIAWVELMRLDERFSKIVVAGHSEGALLGKLAVIAGAGDMFISIAGTSYRADRLILQQLQTQPSFVIERSSQIINRLLAGQTVDDVEQIYYALFRPSIQKYLISWFQHDPVEVISRVEKPTLIIHGRQDSQVPVNHAEALHKANPVTKLEVLDSMNHVLKDVGADGSQNLAAYSDPSIPLHPELVETIVSFVR